ncbi:hypothetical protein D9613_007440 [Agrocybe pediades]|uniref:DUF7918 domain-containing protein n=1 Tax=Agrocybe pediades TaxID=84607 RepID=A0A8H4VMZ8_9AGAR|nr:hypothetical protein D9613_007440 [Agrocybe pediades]
MPSIGNYSAWIEVDGKRLPEYQIKYSGEGKQASCYIPSELGKEFVICYEDNLRAIATIADAKVDGSKTIYGYYIPPYKEYQERCVARTSGVLTGNAIRPFVFAACELSLSALDSVKFDFNHILDILTDDDNASKEAITIGKIVVHVWQVSIVGYARNADHGDSVDLPPLRIHEQAKKGIDHGVQLGPAKPVKSPAATLQGARIAHLVSFGFRYRPLGKL